jgi:hypothetical protein
MDVQVNTLPVVCLPFRLPVGKRRELVLELGSKADMIVLHDKAKGHSRELADMVLDIIWCCNLDEEVMVIGSEEGDHVYVVNTKNLEVDRKITVAHYEDYSWRKFAILSTPDGKHVAIVSELKFLILTWDGRNVMERDILMSDSLVALENTSITFYDNSQEGSIIYTFPG